MTNCEAYRDQLTETVRAGLAPPARLRSHLDSCAACASFLDTQVALQSSFASIRRETQDICPDLEPRLMAEFDRSAGAGGPAFRWPWAAAALAASLTVALALFRTPAPSLRRAERPFLEIPYTAPLAPYERTRIVRMQVPVAALVAAGFEVHAADAGGALEADVLFGQDGRAHALRPISDSSQEN